MLPGAVGFRWMPRKMAGMAMMTIEPSIVAMVMLSVVFDSATHRYRSPPYRSPRSRPPRAGPLPPACSVVLCAARRCSAVCCFCFVALRTIIELTATNLLVRNYLSAGADDRAGQGTGGALSGMSGYRTAIRIR